MTCGCFLFHRKNKISLQHDRCGKESDLFSTLEYRLHSKAFFSYKTSCCLLCHGDQDKLKSSSFLFHRKRKIIIRLKKTRIFHRRNYNFLLRSINGYSFLGERRKPTKTSVSHGLLEASSRTVIYINIRV